MKNITLTFDAAEYEEAKHELLGEYFQKKVERGEISFLRALLIEHKIAKDVEQSENDIVAGRYKPLTAELLTELKQ